MWTGARQRLQCVTASAASAEKKAPTMMPRCATCTALENEPSGWFRPQEPEAAVCETEAERDLAAGIGDLFQRLRKKTKAPPATAPADDHEPGAPSTSAAPAVVSAAPSAPAPVAPVAPAPAPAPPIEQDVELDRHNPVRH